MRASRSPFLAAAVLAMAFGSSSRADDVFLRGDVTGSPRLGLADAIGIFQGLFLAGGAPLTCRDAADVDDNGALEITDGIALLGFLFLGERPPAEPFLLCGGDPTEDSLGCERFTRCDRQFLERPLEGDGVVFVIERSVNMFATGMLDIAKVEIARMLSELPSGSPFGIVFFNEDVVQFPFSGVAATVMPAVVASALKFVGTTSAGGESCVREGLLAGVELGRTSSASVTNLVYFGSADGRCGGEEASDYFERTLADVTATNGGEVVISALATLSPDPLETDFMDRLAKRNGGAFVELDAEELSRRFGRFTTSHPGFLGVPFQPGGVFFVIDRSGSMHATGALDIAKGEIVRILLELPLQTHFGVVFFDRGVLQFPSSGVAAAATPELRASAIDFVQTMPGGAGACVRDGLLAGLELARSAPRLQKTLVYFGDGGGTCNGENEPAYLARTLEEVRISNGGAVVIHTLGTLNPSSSAREFLMQLAAENGGTFAVFDLDDL